MVLKVSVAILPFLTLFVSLIVIFAFIVHTLGINFKTQDEDNPYRNIGALGYFLFIFRTSTGDFDVDNFSELSLSLQLTLWAFWTLLVLLNMVVFLNFLIAVIGDVYM